MDIHKVITTQIALTYDDLLYILSKKYRCNLGDVSIFISDNKLDGVLIKRELKVKVNRRGKDK